MPDHFAEVRRHVEAAAALLQGLESSTSGDVQGETATSGSRLGVQIDATELANLVELASRLGLTPTNTLKLALRALEVELSKSVQQRGARLVGAERALLEGKR